MERLFFETSNSSIYAMTFRHSVDNPLFKNATKDKKKRSLPSPKLLSINQHSESNQLENKVGNNEQAKLPDSGEFDSLLTILFGFVECFLE